MIQNFKGIFYITLGILYVLFLSCSQPKERNPKNGVKHASTELKINQLRSEYTTPYVIYYYPDSLGKKKLMEINSDADFELIINDNLDYNFEITEFLDSIGIKTIISDEAFFTYNNRKDTLLRSSLSSPYFGLILFRNNEEPKEITRQNYRILNYK